MSFITVYIFKEAYNKKEWSKIMCPHVKIKVSIIHFQLPFICKISCLFLMRFYTFQKTQNMFIGGIVTFNDEWQCFILKIPHLY